MRFDRFVQGLLILGEHYKRLDDEHVNPNDDGIWLSETDTPLSKTEVATLRERGWKQLDDNYDELKEYRPEAAWLYEG